MHVLPDQLDGADGPESDCKSDAYDTFPQHTIILICQCDKSTFPIQSHFRETKTDENKRSVCWEEEKL